MDKKNIMKKQLENILADALAQIKIAETEEALKNIEVEYLWRKWKLTEILKWVSSLSKEDRPVVGQMSNKIKNKILEEIKTRQWVLEENSYKILWEVDSIDVTAPTIWWLRTWTRHPISKFIDEVVETFWRMWFSLAQGDEIESEWYNFTALNLWPDHPAREMQDTFFVKDLRAPKDAQIVDDRDRGYVLRTQTSDVQIHYMLENSPPISCIAPWKTFRKDSDATHSPMFHQCEGLFIDKNVSIWNLKYVLLTALRELLNDPNMDLRFRLSYFPFTEPSMEIDVTCPICSWKDDICKVCKWWVWLEVGGCWMVHPDVLRNWWIDPEKYNWFAFGVWIDRLVMLKHRINDLRLFFENDLRFLKQF